MAANATQKAHVVRNLGHIEQMNQHMIEASQGLRLLTIADFRRRMGGATNAVPVNGCTDTVLYAAWAAVVAEFGAS